SSEALTTGGVSTPISKSEFIANYGADQGQRHFQQYDATVQAGRAISAMATMSPEGRNAVVQGLAPKPGEDGYALKQHAYEIAQTAQQHIEQAIKTDPAAFAIQRLPASGAAYKAFQAASSGAPVVSADGGPEAQASQSMSPQVAAQRFAATTLLEQSRAGVPPDAQRIVPKSYIDHLATELLTPDKDGGASKVASRLQAEAKLWGDHWPDIYRQFAPATEPIVRVLGAGVQPAAASRLVNSMNVKEGDLLKNQENPQATVAKITQAVDTKLDAFYKSLSGSARDITSTDFRSVATRLATLYLGDSQIGDDVDKAAKKATDDIVNFKYDFKDGYRIPKDQQLNPDVIQAGAAEARRLIGGKDALGDAFSVAPKIDRAFPGRTDLADDTAERARNNGVWMTDPKEQGLVLFQPDGNAVRRPDGTPLSLSWQQLTKLGGSRSAARSADVDRELAASKAAGTAAP
ncbi:MAG TPA: hypothetical protein VIO16_14165, partial [Dehalococcoidia bacterium]